MMDLFRPVCEQGRHEPPSDYIAHIRQEAKRAEGLNAEEAKRAVELEDQ
ncbi:MAG: hypothetical protein ACLUIW_07995 [Dysosmobacter welbionis]